MAQTAASQQTLNFNSHPPPPQLRPDRACHEALQFAAQVRVVLEGEGVANGCSFRCFKALDDLR